MATTKRQLPTLMELHYDVDKAYANDKLNLLLNQEPHEKWIKKHPIIKVKNAEGRETALQYLPVERVESLLTMIFQEWRREIKTVQIILNSIVTTVRVHYLNPVTGEWSWQDGVGACPIQTGKGSGAGDFSDLKTAGVQMAAPASASYALKDAAECLGKLFGKDLNKWGAAKFQGAYAAAGEKEDNKKDETGDDYSKPITQASISAKYTPPAEDENEFDM